MSLDLHALTAAIYLSAAVMATLGASLRHARLARAAVAALAVGALVHAAAFFAYHDFQVPPPSTGLAGATSLMAWFGTVFYLAVRRGRFDAIVCMYHDQGHIPLKLLDFEGGVNVALGLPIIRTSVDHGTAFDIAYQGVASTVSLIKALDFAARLAGAPS